MTVEELIAELEMYEASTEVMIQSDDGALFDLDAGQIKHINRDFAHYGDHYVVVLG